MFKTKFGGFSIIFILFYVISESITGLMTEPISLGGYSQGFGGWGSFALQMVMGALFNKQNPSVKKGKGGGREGGGGSFLLKIRNASLIYRLWGGRGEKKKKRG